MGDVTNVLEVLDASRWQMVHDPATELRGAELREEGEKLAQNREAEDGGAQKEGQYECN